MDELGCSMKVPSAIPDEQGVTTRRVERPRLQLERALLGLRRGAEIGSVHPAWVTASPAWGSAGACADLRAGTPWASNSAGAIQAGVSWVAMGRRSVREFRRSRRRARRLAAADAERLEPGESLKRKPPRRRSTITAGWLSWRTGYRPRTGSTTEVFAERFEAVHPTCRDQLTTRE